VRALGNLLAVASLWLPNRTLAMRRLVAATGWAGRIGRLAGWRYKEYRVAR
jgi:hypothetical protein